MSPHTIVLLIVSAFVIVPGTVMVVRSFLKNRAEELAPFRDYFGAEYERDLLRQSSWSDEENLYGVRTRFAFNIRDHASTERYPRGSSITRQNRNRD
jgi:hypothetical protein